jgi:hypothetical protein
MKPATTAIERQMRALSIDHTKKVIQAGMFVSLPMEVPARRLCSDSVHTAVANPFSYEQKQLQQIEAVDTPGYDVADNAYDAMIVTRSPLTSDISWNPQFQQSTYDAVFTNPLTFDSTSFTTPLYGGGWTSIDVAYLVWSAGGKLHGDTVYNLRLGSKTYFWLGPGDITIAATVATSATFRMFALRGRDEELIREGDMELITALSVDVKFRQQGTPRWDNGHWVRIEASVDAVGPISFSLTVTYGANATPKYNAGWSVKPIPGFEAKATSVSSIAVPAVSMLVSNSSTELSKNGSIIMAQIPSATPYWDLMQAGPAAMFERVGSVNRSMFKRDNFATGGYTFLKPSTSADLGFIPYQSYDLISGKISTESTPVDSAGDYLYAGVALETDDAVPVGNNYAITRSWGVDFETMDSWFYTNTSDLTIAEVQQVCDLIAHVPQFHENPFHFSDITKFMKTAGSKFMDLLPALSTAVSAVVPEAAPVLMPLTAAAESARKLAR